MQKILILTMVFVGAVLSAQTKLEGTVKDSSGRPIEGCEVFLDNTNYYYLTESDGKYSMDIETPGKYTMKASAFSFKNASKDLELVDGENTNDFVLELPTNGKSSITNLKEIVEYIKNNKEQNISVIASGDPSIYGIGKYLSNNFDKSDLNIVSGISSMQYIFSKICVDMNDLYITSSHGKSPDFDYILNHKKVCMVTDNKIGPKGIAKEILKRNLDRVMIVGENLSYDNEKITIAKPSEIIEIEKFDMNVVVILDEK